MSCFLLTHKRKDHYQMEVYILKRRSVSKFAFLWRFIPPLSLMTVGVSLCIILLNLHNAISSYVNSYYFHFRFFFCELFIPQNFREELVFLYIFFSSFLALCMCLWGIRLILWWPLKFISKILEDLRA